MKNLVTILSAALAVTLSACAPKAEINIIPSPKQVELKSGSYKIAGAAVSYENGLDARTVKVIMNFAEKLSTVTGKVSDVKENLQEEGVSFVSDPSLGAEAYAIDVTKKGVKVSASSFNGFLYALQTLGQLLPAEYYASYVSPMLNWSLPCVSIKDEPRFAYRGVHLDVARHFFSVEDVKKYLDIMALYKENTLHWHLTEDQGWRIEIKKYPRLTEVGSQREGTMVGHLSSDDQEIVLDGVPYGGYYTQEQIREIVAYAEGLGITIIPEIDLPGHMIAALASYPELGCTGGPYKVWTRWGIAKEVLCVGQEKTFTFLEDVLTEVMELFPSKYIHIGGDECPKDAWQKCPKCQKRIKELGLKSDEKHTAEQYLQSYVTERIQKFLNDNGRKMIGWDEILEGKLAEGATVMSWRGVAGGIEAAKMGFDAIMTPTKYMYFDYYQSDKKELEPLAIGGFLPIDTVYAYRPLKDIPVEAQKHILGVQANVWTEYIPTPEQLQYMLLPRLAALSEVQWCEPDNKDFERFKKKLTGYHFALYDTMGYTYSKAIVGEYGRTNK